MVQGNNGGKIDTARNTDEFWEQKPDAVIIGTSGMIWNVNQPGRWHLPHPRSAKAHIMVTAALSKGQRFHFRRKNQTGDGRRKGI